MFGKPLELTELPSVVNAHLDCRPRDILVDKKGGASYNQFERCRSEVLWKDRLGREASTSVPGHTPGFQMNMANNNVRHQRMEIVTEKEHKQSPQTRQSTEGMPQESLEVSMIKHLFKTPPEKQALPATSSQEMSWLLSKHVRPDTFRRQAMARESARDAAPSCGSPFGRSQEVQLVQENPMMPTSQPMPTSMRVWARSQSDPQLPREHSDGNKKLNPAKYQRPREMCAETHYGETFQSLMGRNPYMRNGPAPWSVRDGKGNQAPNWKP